MRKILVVVAILSVLSGCNRSFALFPLQIGTEAGSEEVVLREQPGGLAGGHSSEDEGTLAGPDESLVLAPMRKIDVMPHSSLIVRLSQPAAGLTVVVRDDAGEIIARAMPFETHAAGGAGRAVAGVVPLPDDATIGRFEFSLSEAPAQSVRVLGLSIGSAPAGVGEYAAGAALYASPGTIVRAWGRADSESTWIVERARAEGWDENAPVEIRYRYGGSTEGGPGSAELVAGGARFELDLRPGSNRVILYPEVERLAVDRLVLRSADEGLEVEWIGPLAGDDSLPAARPVDIGTLFRYEPESWRQSDFELFSWTLYPEVLILDSANYDVQARFFRRLAFYVEKAGFRGTLLTDEQLRGRQGYNAHNYNADGLARFFNEARATGIALNAEELLLREVLLANGIIESSGDGFVAGRGGILAVSQESRMIPTLRDLLLSHEAYHGVYYAEPEYVRRIDALWDSLDDEQQRYWRLLLAGLQYDVDDGYLLRNEYHAYLLQQPVASASWYFETRSAERIARWYPASAAWIQSYLVRYRGTHREQAEAAEAILSSITGLEARDVACLEPVEIR